MTASQASLEGRATAEQLEENQRAISVAEFFEKNKHMLGFDSKARGLVTAVKEAVDNALDATEEAGYLPDISVEIVKTDGYYSVIVEDNGPGITKDSIPKVFGKLLYGSRFAARQQSRGQQGIGISATVLYGQLTSGKPAKITSKTDSSDNADYYELVIDTDENEPEIRREETREWAKDHGTRIEIEMDVNMRARDKLHRYIRRTAVVNPHARITFKEPSTELTFDRVTDELPDETEEIKPHPNGVELGTLQKMLLATDSYSLSGFLQEEFTKVGAGTAQNILDEFRDAQYGRIPAWELTETDAMHTAVVDAVNGKSPDATDAFAESLVTTIQDETDGVISYETLNSVVESCADSIEDETDVRFGSTVRENTTSALWNLIRESRFSILYSAADSATSNRKGREEIETFANALAEKFEQTDDSRDAVTKEELRAYVETSATRTANHHDVSFGETAQENIVEELWETVLETVPDEVPKVKDVSDDRDTASNLLTGMQNAKVYAPPATCLSPIGEDNIRSGLETVFENAEFYSANTRDSSVVKGDPVIVEAGIAYGGSIEKEENGKSADILRFANRVPLVYARGGCASTDAATSIGWKTYKVDQPGGRGLPQGPLVILVHVASTNVPFTNESKDALANVPVIENEIEQAIRGAARPLRDHIQEKDRLSKRRQKVNTVGPALQSMAVKLEEMTEREQIPVKASEANIMNNLFVSVDRDSTDDGVSVRLRNHDGRNLSPEIVLQSSTEPRDVPDGAEVTEQSNGWRVAVTPTLSKEESYSAVFDVSEDAVETVQINNVAEEKVTYNE